MTLVFGVGQVSKKIGFQGKTARVSQPDLLWKQSSRALETFRAWSTTGYELQNPLFDPPGFVDALESPTLTLRQALDDLKASDDRSKRTLSHKTSMRDQFDRVHKASVGILAGFFLLVLREDLVRKVRATLREGKAKG